ncbi:MAG: sulfotransferase [Pseudomonadota bacterium]
MENQTAKSLKSKAVALLDSGKLQQALKKAQLGMKRFPGDSDYQAIAGFVLTEMKQYKRSIPHFVEAARMKPNDPQFAENLANALMQTGQIDRALTYAEQKADQFPANKELARVIHEIKSKGNNWRSIIEYLTDKLSTDPNNTDYLARRSRAYGHIGFFDASVRDIARAYDLAPNKTHIAFRKAVNLHFSGDKAGSIKILCEVLETEPDHTAALFQMSSLVSREAAPDLLERVNAVISARDYVSSSLKFARADLISKIEGLDKAMALYTDANATQHEKNPYNFSDEEAKYTSTINNFPVDQAAAGADIVNNPVPVFVIGQPRSGTTLMEMMLSSAPNIAGCGELTLGADLAIDYWKNATPFDKSAAHVFAESFRKMMPPIPEGSIAFVDKMPHNYQRVGFLLAAFPNAKVINMLRDPRDVGLSKWIRRFPANGMNYASNLKSIAHSANLYRRYMAHWDAVYGDQILTVSYEDLVADPKTYSQQVAAFCDLEWQESMMHPEKNTKEVRTASIDQVRKKISTKSIGGWRNVAEHIQPMLDGFDPDLWPEYTFD